MPGAEDVIVASDQAVWCELGGEAVILDVRAGRYFALSAVAAEIWKLIESRCTLTEVCRRLSAEYEVEPARCEADVLRLLGQLAEHGLVSFEAPIRC